MPVYSYKTKQGIKYRYRFKYNNEKYEKGGFTSAKVAKAEESIRRNKVNNGGSGELTFNNMVEQYLEDAKHHVRQSTFANKKRIFNNHVIGKIPNKKINEIKPIDIRKWQNDLIALGFEETYLKTLNNQLSAAFNYATRYCELSANPVKLSGSIGKGKRSKFDFWTLEEFNFFCASVTDVQLYLAIQALFFTGLRVGELRALTWSDIDFDVSEISVNKTVVWMTGGMEINPPKTPQSERIVKIDKNLNALFKNWKSKQYKPLTTEQIFSFGRDRIRYQIVTRCKMLEIKPIRVHDLRHSHASLLIDLDVSIKEICERLGHTSIKTTMDIYGHLYPHRQQKTIDKLDLL